MTIRSTFFLAAVWIALAGPARAHEFWIDAEQYQLDSGAQVVARFRNGQLFEGIDLAFFPNRSHRFEIVLDGRATKIAPRLGDSPAVDVPAPGDGLAVVIHETTPSTVRYKTWDDFAAFAEHKDFPGIRAAHEARGLPTENFDESYTRHAKALIAIGDGAGADAAMGMETEFIALANPYTDDLSAGLPVRLMYQGAIRADAQVEIFDRAPGAAVTVTLTRTDADGRAIIPVQPGHTYLIDAVVLRPAPEGGTAVWETLWAALTFAVP